jgi:arginase family enzyme
LPHHRNQKQKEGEKNKDKGQVISAFAFIFANKNFSMDVQYYFNPVDFSQFHHSGHISWKYSLGAAIERNSKDDIKKINIAIVGIPFDSRKDDASQPESPDKIRAELYQLSKFDTKLKIADFGNVKPASSIKGNYQALRDIVDYFNELKIVTVVIGGSQDLSLGVWEAFKGNKFFSFTAIDAFLDVKNGNEPFGPTNFLSRLFSSKQVPFLFSLIGFQSHYLTSASFGKIQNTGNHIRLGSLRDNIAIAEPVLRDTDFLSFDMNSVKHSDASGTQRVSPNGLRSEEACQLAKYAGLSNRLKVFGMFDVLTKNDRDDLTVKLAAQIIWYFIEGFVNRDIENPGLSDNCVVFKVEVEGIDKPIVFYRNTNTNQWWIEIETDDKAKYHFACSENEYIVASNNEIPGLWLNYIQKIDEVLK